MSYAIIAIGGKQYRVREGQRLLVDRISADEGATLTPTVLFVGGDGEADLSPQAVVTARVVGHVLGDKVRIGKYRPKKGYRRHAGFRAKLSQIEIAEIGARKSSRPAKAEREPVRHEQATKAGDIPAGYPDMTVAKISEAAAGWDRSALEAALAYEREHAARKGAVAALESAIAHKESD